MRYIESELGGRYRYNEDFRSIQDTVLAFAEILRDCGNNFVITGCKDGQEGYVWLNGKIRYVPALASGESGNYIVCNDSEGPEVQYGDDTKHKLYDEYGAAYCSTKKEPCLSKTNGSFPTIRECFWEYYGVAKNSKSEQVVNIESSFNNGIETEKVIIGDNTSLYITDSEIIIESGKCGISLSSDSPLIGIRSNGKTVTTLGGEVAASQVFGNLTMPKLTGESFNVGKVMGDEYYIDGGIGICDVLQAATYRLDTGWLPFANTTTNTSYSNLMARQQKDKVFIRGTIGSEYIVNGADSNYASDPISLSKLSSSSHFTLVSHFLTHEVDQNGNEVDKKLDEDKRPQIVKLKLNLKMPDGITLPEEGRLPGCLIMGTYPENYMESDKKNFDIDSYYSIGNAQLTLGSDGFLYVIIGTGHKLYFGNQSPVISFNYLV